MEERDDRRGSQVRWRCRRVPAGNENRLTEEDVRGIVRDEIKRAWAKNPASRRAALVAPKGTLDWAYPPLILNTATP